MPASVKACGPGTHTHSIGGGWAVVYRGCMATLDNKLLARSTFTAQLYRLAAKINRLIVN